MQIHLTDETTEITDVLNLGASEAGFVCVFVWVIWNFGQWFKMGELFKMPRTAKRWEIWLLWLLLNTNRKSYVGSPAVPLNWILSMSDFERPTSSSLGLWWVIFRWFRFILLLTTDGALCLGVQWRHYIWLQATFKSQSHSEFEAYIS